MAVGTEWRPDLVVKRRKVLGVDGQLHCAYNLETLRNIRLKLDMENLLTYARYRELSGKRDPSEWALWGYLRRMAGITSFGKRELEMPQACRAKGYKRWDVLGRCSDLLEVPMELLIDEDYYWNRSGIAGYRILCEVYRQKVNLRDLTYHERYSEDPRFSNSWYRTWTAVLACRWVEIERTRGDFFSMVLQRCWKVLNVPLGELVSHRLHRTGASGTFAVLSNLLAALGPRECAVVAGVAKSLHDCKFSGRGYDVGLLRKSIDSLLEWYERGSEDKVQQAQRG